MKNFCIFVAGLAAGLLVSNRKTVCEKVGNAWEAGKNAFHNCTCGCKCEEKATEETTSEQA